MCLPLPQLIKQPGNDEPGVFGTSPQSVEQGAPPPPPDEEDIDLDDLVDAAPGTVPTTLDRLAEAFPGSQLVERGD